MNVTLTPHLEALIQRKLDSGEYRDASDVVREAMEALEARDRFNRTRAAIAVGLAEVERGEGVLWTEHSMAGLQREAEEEDRLGLPISDDVLP